MAAIEHTHSKLLREAALEFLKPLGLTQKGRSRTWLDDRGWWLCVVEFQPSGFSRGSYLNVGCMWLWQEKDYITFDQGNRVEGFAAFENEDKFRLVATKLAARAATEVRRYRTLFSTVVHVSDYYLKINPTGFWPSFDAAIACGVAGRKSEARRFFAQVLDSNDELDWVKQAKTEASHWNSLVDDTEAFRQAICETVTRTRRKLKLPEEKLVTLS